jgi:hypothetical protein
LILENAGVISLRNVGNQQACYSALQPRRPDNLNVDAADAPLSYTIAMTSIFNKDQEMLQERLRLFV